MKDDLTTPPDTRSQTVRHPVQGMRQVTVGLRLLATTDVHMQLLGYDYIRDKPLAHHGLAGLSTLVSDARAEATAQQRLCILCDNGDFLQGSVLGERLATQTVTPSHPVVQCLDHMAYDAVGVGNHDLDHGLRYLRDVAQHSTPHWISSNLIIDRDDALARSVILRRDCTSASGSEKVSLRIGLVSALPELTSLWTRDTLRDAAEVRCARASVSETVRDLRAQGADIVVLLAHFGVEDRNTQEQDARSLAGLPGIDAVVAGHTHLRLPGADHRGVAGVDTMRSTLAERPATMPGFDGSDLAVMDLDLTRNADGIWRVDHHRAQLRPNSARIVPDPRIVEICAPAHLRTCLEMAQPVGRIDRTMHNFFSLAAPTATCALVARAKHMVVEQALRDHPDGHLPILAAVSAHTAGGRGGAAHYLNVPAGKVLRRHLAGLSPYANEICALRVTGADLRDWLENAARIYCHLSLDSADQNLVEACRPSFDFDTIFGVTYTIDPTRRAGERIVSLQHGGRDIGPDHCFVLATNQFRLAGGGGGTVFASDRILFRSRTPLANALARTLQNPAALSDLNETPWRFTVPQPVRVRFQTSPDALAHLDEIAHLKPEADGISAGGFARLTLTLQDLHPH